VGTNAGGVALEGVVVGSVLAVDPAGLAPFGPARFAVVSVVLVALALALRSGGAMAKGPMVAWARFFALVAVQVALVAAFP
jgi:hypothetical protein